MPQVPSGNKANLYDTIGRLNAAIGEFDSAINAQKLAVQFSDGSDEGGFTEFLLELQSEAKKRKK